MSRDDCIAVAEAVVEWLAERRADLAVLCVSRTHLHACATLPGTHKSADARVADVKRSAALYVDHTHPRPIWAQRAAIKDVNGPRHFRVLYPYLRDRQERGSADWTARDGHFVSGVDPVEPCEVPVGPLQDLERG